MATGIPDMQRGDLRSRVGSLQQFAGVRRLVLDDGPERGVAVLELSTGGGLDFWVMADRGLDIGMLRWRGVPVAWQSPQGFMHPALGHVEGDGGRGFARMLSGFLCTCGLDGVRQPVDGRPLHGRLAMVPARVSTAAAMWDLPVPVLRVEGECVQYRQGGENLRLHRVIEAVIGGSEIRLTDTVTNDGDQPQPHDLLYHFNLGYPSIGPGTTVEQAGATAADPVYARWHATRANRPADTAGRWLAFLPVDDDPDRNPALGPALARSASRLWPACDRALFKPMAARRSQCPCACACTW